MQYLYKKISIKLSATYFGNDCSLFIVGIEVSTASNLPSYMENNLGFSIGAIAPNISLYWASLMIGRWTGAVEVFTDDLNTLKNLRFVAPYLGSAYKLY